MLGLYVGVSFGGADKYVITTILKYSPFSNPPCRADINVAVLLGTLAAGPGCKAGCGCTIQPKVGN